MGQSYFPPWFDKATQVSFFLLPPAAPGVILEHAGWSTWLREPALRILRWPLCSPVIAGIGRESGTSRRRRAEAAPQSWENRRRVRFQSMKERFKKYELSCDAEGHGLTGCIRGELDPGGAREMASEFARMARAHGCRRLWNCMRDPMQPIRRTPVHHAQHRARRRCSHGMLTGARRPHRGRGRELFGIRGPSLR